LIVFSWPGPAGQLNRQEDNTMWSKQMHRAASGAVRSVGLVCVLAMAGPAISAENFGNRTPSVDELMEAFDPPKSRTVMPSSAKKEAPPSVSMQITFSVNSFKISDDSAEKLSNIAAVMKNERLQDKTFKIIGHTDASGSEMYNVELSNRRARAVRDQLLRLGVDGARLEPVGKGKADLLDKQNPFSPENRRVEFALSGK
jgi:outer membrane protein OmpA-like peptidoglycan-associated protein